MQTVFLGDSLHELSILFPGENIVSLSSAEFAYRVVKVNVISRSGYGEK